MTNETWNKYIAKYSTETVQRLAYDLEQGNVNYQREGSEHDLPNSDGR
jgi:hypothetical protein